MANNDTELTDKILELKAKRSAVILAHNYQRGEVQDIADFVGDSLGLSLNAAGTEADVIVFCGVHFMAETASILCPGKKVLLPDINAGCPMANMITTSELIKKKQEYPDASVVCYINSSAEIKSESDVCCTSANAVEVIESLNSNEILFVPDQYLGHYISTKTSKNMILWPGFCPTHLKIDPHDIINRRREHPEAVVMVHPECTPEVIALADQVLSTGGMCRFARQTGAETIIVGTELGMMHRLNKENPGKKFIPATEKAVCPNMKLITLEKILWALEDMAPEVKVRTEVSVKAKRAVDMMLETGRPQEASRR